MRITWIDTMKGVAMIAVVLGHVVQGYLVAGMFPEERTILQALFDFIYAWHMPLFFMASGYLYEMTWHERPCNIFARIREKFFDMFILYILFSLLFWGTKYLAASRVQMNHIITIEELSHIFVQPLSYLWFLYVLIILFIAVPLLARYIPDKKIFLAILGASYLLWGDFGISGRVLFGGFYFVLGSWLRQIHFEGINRRMKRALLGMSGTVCVINAAAYLEAWGGQGNTLREITLALAASYLVWCLFAEIWDKKRKFGTPFLRLCGQKCLELYLLHVYFVGFLRTAFRKMGIDEWSLCLILGTVIAVVGSLTIAYLCGKNRYLQYLFRPADGLRKCFAAARGSL